MSRRAATVLGVAAIAAASAAPYAVWRAAPERELDVVVLDNTVPDSSYREHSGLVWLLNHGKYQSPTHGEYLPARDYFGFFPRSQHRFRIRPLHDTIAADLIYLADAYGVYEKEWLGSNPLGERSPRVYGGMSPAEMTKVERATRAGTPLVVEFNTFASPTGAATRERLYDLLQVEWSGWIGRYFNDLSVGVEVPKWAVDAWEQQHRRVWRFTGEGFLLADEHDTIIVLQPGSDYSSGQCETIFTDYARSRLGVENRIRYRYWFDIVRLREGASELAHFNLDLTGDGLKKLRSYGVPASFPAVVRHDAPTYRAYYFAGDFTDTRSIPRHYQVYGYDRLKALFTLDRAELENQPFFWRVYAPMMRTILDEAYELKRARQHSVP